MCVGVGLSCPACLFNLNLIVDRTMTYVTFSVAGKRSTGYQLDERIVRRTL